MVSLDFRVLENPCFPLKKLDFVPHPLFSSAGLQSHGRSRELSTNLSLAGRRHWPILVI